MAAEERALSSSNKYAAYNTDTQHLKKTSKVFQDKAFEVFFNSELTVVSECPIQLKDLIDKFFQIFDVGIGRIFRIDLGRIQNDDLNSIRSQ